MAEPSSAQRLAEHVRDGLFAGDRASQALGMQVTEIGPGRAVLTMRVREDMLNGHGMCHGGVIATLADSAFAFASNAGNELTVSSGLAIDFITPAHCGDVLEARCAEVFRTGRTGVYDATVSNQRGECLAVFRGRSYAMRGKTAVPINGS
ncbi:hydroxyphenylacetyl-CoA thioesterase PaaI [Methylibium petroleiphilum]|uniref:hydroxyphenylacetyl-CoA thioesterase PaaI n=1 Tax=Methylibium petroleiphilum TaxID=105560 RepID=UPI003D2A8655